MKHFLLTAALLAGTALALPAMAADASKMSNDFVQKAAMTDKFEIESSQLALEKSSNAKVKGFAQQMIDDHTKSTSDLKAALGDSEVDPALTDKPLDAKHAKILSNLKASKGKKFDEAYLSAQKDGHKQAVDLFSKYAKHGDETSLKDFASKTLPVIEGHKNHVSKLKASM